MTKPVTGTSQNKETTLDYFNPLSWLGSFFCVPKLKEQVNNFQEHKEKRHKISGLISGISIVTIPTNACYQAAYVTKLVLNYLAIPLIPLTEALPIVNLVYSCLEAMKDILSIVNTRQVQKKLQETLNPKKFCLLDSNLNSNKANLSKLQTMMDQDGRFSKIFGEKNIKALTDEVNKAKEDELYNQDKIEKTINTQIKKAYIIHALSVVCLSLSIAAVVAGIMFAPPLTLFAIAAAAIVITTMRNVAVPAYLHQEGHKIHLPDAIPEWCKKRYSYTMNKCSAMFSCFMHRPKAS
jgi:hypothetical protein